MRIPNATKRGARGQCGQTTKMVASAVLVQGNSLSTRSVRQCRTLRAGPAKANKAVMLT